MKIMFEVWYQLCVRCDGCNECDGGDYNNNNDGDEPSPERLMEVTVDRNISSAANLKSM